MKTTRTRNLTAAALICALVLGPTIAQAADPSTSLGAGPLLSWSDGPAKKAVIDFVAA